MSLAQSGATLIKTGSNQILAFCSKAASGGPENVDTFGRNLRLIVKLCRL